MTQRTGFFDDFGMDTISLAGSLDGQAGGDARGRLHAGDAQGQRHRRPPAAASTRRWRVVRASGLRVTGFQVLRDFEGLSGHLHDYKVDIAKGMLEMAQRRRRAAAAGLLVDQPACQRPTSTRSPATCASWRCWRVPLGIKVAYEGLSWGRTINEFTTAWDVVQRADAPNLGLGFDSYHALRHARPRSTTWSWSTRARSSWCSWPTSCGRRSARWKSASAPRAPSASSPAKACTARRWPSW